MELLAIQPTHHTNTNTNTPRSSPPTSSLSALNDRDSSYEGDGNDVEDDDEDHNNNHTNQANDDSSGSDDDNNNGDDDTSGSSDSHGDVSELRTGSGSGSGSGSGLSETLYSRILLFSQQVRTTNCINHYDTTFTIMI